METVLVTGLLYSRKRFKEALNSDIKSGVYRITNITNRKVYVGSAKYIRIRLKGHLASLRKGVHENSYLQRSWNKYGEDNFKFEVVDLCESELLIEHEQNWLDLHQAATRKNGYNISPTAGSCAGVKHTKKSKKNMSVSQRKRWEREEEHIKASESAKKAYQENPELISKSSECMKELWKDPKFRKKVTSARRKAIDTPEYRANMSKSKTGHRHTEESKKKMSELKKGNKYGVGNRNRLGKVHTEESKRKMFASHLGYQCSEETKQKIRETWKRKREERAERNNK